MYFILGKPKSIYELEGYVNNSDDTTRRVASVLLIDDEDFIYLDTLRRNHFNINHIRNIDDIRATSEYHVILCDIEGVGKKLSDQYQGAHVIKEIKRLYPSKIVVAYSGQSFNASYNDYFALADDFITKDSDCDKWIETLEDAIRKAFNPVNQWLIMREILIKNKAPLHYILQLEDEFVVSIQKKKQIFPNKTIINSLSDNLQKEVRAFATSFLFKLIGG